MVACGVDYNQILQGDSGKPHLEKYLFKYEFKSYRDNIYENINANFKAYADLTHNQGKIRLLP